MRVHITALPITDRIELRIERPTRLDERAAALRVRQPERAGGLRQELGCGDAAGQPGRHVRQIDHLHWTVAQQRHQHRGAGRRQGDEFESGLTIVGIGQLERRSRPDEIAAVAIGARGQRHRIRVDLAQLPGRVDVDQNEIAGLFRRDAERDLGAENDIRSGKDLDGELGRICELGAARKRVELGRIQRRPPRGGSRRQGCRIAGRRARDGGRRGARRMRQRPECRRARRRCRGRRRRRAAGRGRAGEGCSTAGGVGAAAGAGVGAAMMRTPRELSPGPVRSLPAHAGRTSAAAIAGARTRRTIRFDLAGRVIAVLRAR